MDCGAAASEHAAKQPAMRTLGRSCCSNTNSNVCISNSLFFPPPPPPMVATPDAFVMANNAARDAGRSIHRTSAHATADCASSGNARPLLLALLLGAAVVTLVLFVAVADDDDGGVTVVINCHSAAIGAIP